MAHTDSRWRQRFDNFQRALLVLERGVELARSRELSELEQAQQIAHDVIDRFAPAFASLRNRFAALSAEPA
jgi:hypothetical protein